jgi:hypothetical protein
MIEGNEHITSESLSNEEFKGLLDIFRTLLEWEREAEYGRNEEHESNTNQ